MMCTDNPKKIAQSMTQEFLRNPNPDDWDILRTRVHN
jgi:hypothetical protein